MNLIRRDLWNKNYYDYYFFPFFFETSHFADKLKNLLIFNIIRYAESAREKHFFLSMERKVFPFFLSSFQSRCNLQFTFFLHGNIGTFCKPREQKLKNFYRRIEKKKHFYDVNFCLLDKFIEHLHISEEI